MNPSTASRDHAAADSRSRARVRLTLRVDVDGKAALGHGKIRLLEHVGETGSISAAARSMGMSYRRAWLLVEALNGMFTQPLVDTKPGGGGGARITRTGERVIRAYRDMEKQAETQASGALNVLADLLARPEKATAT